MIGTIIALNCTTVKLFRDKCEKNILFVYEIDEGYRRLHETHEIEENIYFKMSQ